MNGATAKLFMHGRSQAVRLPKEFRFEGTEVRVSKVGDKVILEPSRSSRSMSRRGSRGSTNSAGADFLPDGIPDDPPAEPDPRVFFDDMICLDTNIAIYVINRRVPAVRFRLAEQLRLGTEIGLPVDRAVRIALWPCAQRPAGGVRSSAGGISGARYRGASIR